MKKYLTLLLPIILVSCYVNEPVPIAEDMNQWIGKSEQEVKLKFGTPTQTTDDGNNGRILSYQDVSSRTVIIPGQRIDFASTRNHTTYAEYFINSEGKVYSWRTNMEPRTRRVRVKDSQAYKDQLAKNKKKKS